MADSPSTDPTTVDARCSSNLWCRSMPPSASPCVATTLGTCAIGHQARSPGLCRSLHPENVVLTGGRLPVSAPPHVSSHACNCGCLAGWRSPLGGAFVCSLLAVALQVRPVPLCLLAPHAAPQMAAASSGSFVPNCVRLRCCCAWLWLVGGPLRGASSARCWQWPCRCERRLSARSLCAKHRRRRPRRPARSCPSACCGGGAAAAPPLGVGPLAFSVSSRPR